MITSEFNLQSHTNKPLMMCFSSLCEGFSFILIEICAFCLNDVMILKGFVEVKATHTDIQQYKHRRLTLSCTLIGWLFKAVSERTTLSKTFGLCVL